MTDQQGSNAEKILLRGALGVLILLSLCLALLAFLNTESRFELGDLLAGPLFWHAVFLQCIALALFILSWFLLLFFSDYERINYLEAAAHIGVTLVGKYLPGKLWGLLGRTYLLKQRKYATAAAIEFLLADQFLTFYTGIAVGGLSLLLAYNGRFFVLALAVFVATSASILLFYSGLISWLKKFARGLVNLAADSQGEELPEMVAVNRIGLLSAMFVYMVHWLAISLVLWMLYYPVLLSDPWFNALLLSAAIPLAMLSGFLAVWAPGGIGVREAVIVGILALNLPLELAASIAVTYRLICVMNDLATGAIALAYYGGSGLQPLRNQQP
jgi:uncharacterized membrane protein YbhN (UPF0104 family)